MSNYLLLANGISFEVNSNRSFPNTIGQISLCEDSKKINLLPSKIFGDKHINPESKLEFELNENDISKIKNLVDSKNNINCKIVSDNLGIDYHLYDLKNCIAY